MCFLIWSGWVIVHKTSEVLTCEGLFETILLAFEVLLHQMGMSNLMESNDAPPGV